MSLADAIRFIQSLPIIRSIPFAYTAHIIFFFCIYFVYRYLKERYHNYKKKQKEKRAEGGYITINGKEFYKDTYGHIFNSYETYLDYVSAVDEYRKQQLMNYWEYQEYRRYNHLDD